MTNLNLYNLIKTTNPPWACKHHDNLAQIVNHHDVFT
jgi:hypothetical protein